MQKLRKLNKKGMLALVLVLTMVIGSVAMITATDNAYAKTPGSNTIIFDETGLATGTSWSIDFGSGTTLTAYSSTTTSLDVAVTANGTYSFSIVNPNGYSSSPSSGSVSITKYNVSGAQNVTEPITFTPTAKTYPVIFYTGNLTAGQVWSVTVNGVTQSSNTNTVGPFNLENGTYSFSIPNVGHWYATPFKGTFTVSGNQNLPKWMPTGTLQNNITFSYGYVVSFKASGLPLYVPWSVTFNGATNSTTGSSAYVNFSIKNGSSYSYSINIAPDWTASPTSGTVTVSGAAVTQTITFTEVFYKIIFVETGLPSGTAWIININGVPYPTTNGTVIITEHNGSYSYSAESMPGYTASPASGTVTLGYNDVTVHIVYSTTTVKSTTGSTSGGFTTTGISNFFHTETGMLTIVIVVIVIIGLVVVAETRGHENKGESKGNHSKLKKI
jgi:hypothetical protein